MPESGSNCKNANPSAICIQKFKNKMLMIVDPQIDFITGTLPVAGAEKAMDSLSEYLRHHGEDYTRIVVTADRHPMRHCAFIREGGKWPPHCVADSVGAAIWPALMDVLFDFPDKVTILHKGENPDKEEYSIFKNEDAAITILRIIESDEISQADICGLAGDVCVADTVRDGIELIGKKKLNILTSFTPSIDGGMRLSNLIRTGELRHELK